MIPRRYCELMHGELDGVNSPAQSAELRRWLDDHPDARGELDSLRATGRLLAAAAADQAEPPPGLRGRIMGDVRARAAAGASRAHVVRPPRRFAFPGVPAVRYAMCAGLGLAAGVLLVLSLTRAGDLPGSAGDYRGALVPGTGAAFGPSEAFTLGTATGSLRAAREGDLLVADVELAGTAGAPAELSWTGPARLAGAVGIGPGGGAVPAGLVAEPGRVSFEIADAVRCRVLLQAPAGQPVVLRLSLPSGEGGRIEHAFAPR